MRQWKLVNGEGKQIYSADILSGKPKLWLTPPVDPSRTRKPVLTFDPDSVFSLRKLSRARRDIDVKSRWEEIV